MRDIEIKKLRPQIPTIIDENVSSSAELFQNRSLRQILKLQNDLLLQIFKFYILKRKGAFYKLTEPKKMEYIEQSIRKDIKFKNLLLGTIIGTLLATTAPMILAGLLFALAILGWIAAEACPPATPPNPDLKVDYTPITAIWSVLKKITATCKRS